LNHYRASWLLPIAAPPIHDGWLAIEHGRIVELGAVRTAEHARFADLGRVAILPGLVNAHTHLELSYLRHRIPAGNDFVTWIRGVVASRRAQPDPRGPEVLDGIAEGIAEAVRYGTVLVGDISNTLETFAPLAESPLSGVVFNEILRFNAPDPEAVVEQACRQIDSLGGNADVRASLAAHAPYSVAPAVFRAIRRAMDGRPSVPCSVHLSESRDEVEFIRAGSGAWRRFLDDVGAWDPTWGAPGTSPVTFLEHEGFLDARTLAVHGVQMTSADLALLAARGTTLVTCPRSNTHTGAGTPPVAAFYASGVRIAIGTDSLASTEDLNVFAELAALRALAPAVPASRLLESATLEGARALGFEADFGTIAPGKSGRLLAVSIPEDVNDVEEYLVSGVPAGQIRWLAD
jgi:cytosine/adenosine deaminase-related metal-dependent hydrolase